MDLQEILTEIESGRDPDDIRAQLAQKIKECLVERGEELSKRERTHFGLAIDLLQTPWLRLIWTHVDSVCNQRVGTLPTATFEIFGEVPDLPALTEKLAKAIFEIDEHRGKV